MNPAILRQLIAQMTPEQLAALGLRRPATDAEAASYDQAHAPGGAPADFAGPVFSNPDNARVSEDTESGGEPTRLPIGVNFQKQNFSGPMPLDRSNPLPAELGGIHASTVQAKFDPKLPPGAVLDSSPDGDELPPGAVADSPKLPPGAVLDTAEEKHPKGWSTLGEDLVGFVKGLPQAVIQAMPAGASLEEALPAAWQKAFGFTPTNEQVQAMVDHDKARKEQGRSGAYRAIAPVGELAGVNVAGMEESANEGDTAGVLGHAAAVPVVMAATAGLSKGAAMIPESVRTAPVRLASRTAEALANQKVAPIKPILKIMTPADEAGSLHLEMPGRDIGLEKPTPPPPKPVVNAGAPLPKAPAREALQARVLEQGGRAPIDPAKGLGEIPATKTSPGPNVDTALYLKAKTELGPDASLSSVLQRAQELKTDAGEPPVSTGNAPESVPGEIPADDVASAPRGAGIPRTLSGESALTQILTGQDNANLIKIARSRGINVTQEAQLKPGVADTRLIKKIIDDHTPEELGEIRDTYLEHTRFRHNFGDIGPEAWKALSIQTYFPDVKLPAAVLKRTQSAIEAAGKPPAEAMNAPASEAAVPKVPKAPKVEAAPKAKTPDIAKDDLTEKLAQSVEQAKGIKGGVFTSAKPSELLERWGVDPESFAEGRTQTRGMKPQESEAELKKMTAAYKKGQAIEPVLETRDAENNIIDVDGRGRALAAHRAGIERIPVIVRRAGIAKAAD